MPPLLTSSSLLLLHLLAGCGDKGTDSGQPGPDGGSVTDGGADGGDVDPDGGADGGEGDGGEGDGGAPTEEDCGSEGDEDGDGLADCEDPDCVESCLEDCANGEDDDGDGLIDCDDDECLGSSDCSAPYTVTMTTDLDYLHWAFGDDIAARTGGARASMALFGIVDLSFGPYGWTGEGFTCAGEITADTLEGSGGAGALRYAGTATDVDYRFIFEATPYTGLTWFEDCPVNTLGTWELGVHAGTSTIFRNEGTGWMEAYDGGSYDTYTGEYGGLSYTIQWTWNPDQLSPPTWTDEVAPPE